MSIQHQVILSPNGVLIFSALLGTLWVRRVESEHAAHEEHIKAEHGGELPPVPEYDYLNKRGKPFPWGMNSLFYNPHVSTFTAKLPDDSF